jgi:hypothetical protein
MAGQPLVLPESYLRCSDKCGVYSIQATTALSASCTDTQGELTQVAVSP